MNSVMENRKKQISRYQLVTWIIGILSLFLCLSLYVRFNKESILQKLYPPLPEPVNTPGTEEGKKGHWTNELPEELTSRSSILLYVNETHPLPADYVPDDMSKINIPSTGAAIELRKEAGKKAQEMLKAAKEDDIDIYLTAGYRSYKNQEELYASYVSLLGEARASALVEKGGCSEHQTGLSIDITNDPSGAQLNEEFADTDVYKWMSKNAYKYGYILRFPKGKKYITGLSFQPWHYRYVGTKTAKKMHKKDKNITFEEYFGIYVEE